MIEHLHTDPESALECDYIPCSKKYSQWAGVVISYDGSKPISTARYKTTIRWNGYNRWYSHWTLWGARRSVRRNIFRLKIDHEKNINNEDKTWTQKETVRV